ncbi:PREDICTED: uncharacterized protein LOC109243071 [Nicotiana attenuata]|uniref:U-box domain-containing protein 1 n=1 Tax=Nicotiana attenuata TaxID=49451 RepID=A0A314L2F1_NICAT|nr:PREDICTED: uncharacterized protein LOC109243071 [Nicotiana attenuata]OIT35665.1 u-box domain-containing protein 1 [Nicotiana attenuata]
MSALLKRKITSSIERLSNAVTAFFRILISREPTRVFRNGIAPDSAMILRLSIPVFASNLSSDVACLCISGDAVANFPTKNSAGILFFHGQHAHKLYLILLRF